LPDDKVRAGIDIHGTTDSDGIAMVGFGFASCTCDGATGGAADPGLRAAPPAAAHRSASGAASPSSTSWRPGPATIPATSSY